ncbi:MAG: TraR/DksA C4-type zinc finger protein [Verrucomicrobiota bacterium]|nr:TraR/DksA C4-type zinc finger protein [Verrucomicrobiota bacterium]
MCSCGCVIPRERVMAIPDVIYCVNCQSVTESNSPDAMRKKAEEGFGGSREDWGKNRKGYGGDRR